MRATSFGRVRCTGHEHQADCDASHVSIALFWFCKVVSLLEVAGQAPGMLDMNLVIAWVRRRLQQYLLMLPSS